MHVISRTLAEFAGGKPIVSRGSAPANPAESGPRGRTRQDSAARNLISGRTPRASALIRPRRPNVATLVPQAMNPKPVEEALTRELALALPALRRARQRAEEIAIATNTCIVEVKDGRVVHVGPDELKRERAQRADEQMSAFEEILAAIRRLALPERLRLIERARTEAAEDDTEGSGSASGQSKRS